MIWLLNVLFSGTTGRHWLVTLVAGAVSFGSVSYFVSADQSPGIPPSLPPANLSRIDFPSPSTAFMPKRVTDVHELPDVTIDSLKSAGISEEEIRKAVDKLLEEKSLQTQSTLAADHLVPTGQPPTSITAP